jgi:hypothetical protein
MAVAPAPHISVGARLGYQLRRVPKVAWALVAALVIGITVVVLASVFDWSGRSTVAVAAVCAFVFGVIAGPLAFSRPQRAVTLSRVPEGGPFLPSGEATRTTVSRTNDH